MPPKVFETRIAISGETDALSLITLLSMLFDKYKAAGSEKIIALLQKISPVAWQHIHFLGHYAFRDNKHIIDLETMLANITLE